MAKTLDIVKTQAAVADHFGVERSTVHTWRKKGMPGESGRYSLKAITEWRESREEVALLESNSNSPWLEKLRKMKALQEQIKLQHMKGDYVEVARAGDCLAIWSAIIRRLGDRLGTRFGRDATRMVNDAIDECEMAVEAVFPCDTSNPKRTARADTSGSTSRRTAKKGVKKRSAGTKATDKRVGGK